MADVKITSLAVLTAADPINDAIPIVDVSDFTMAASGTTKRISVNNILSSSPTATGAFSVTGLVTAGSATITGAATVGTTLSVTGVSTFAAGTALLPALTTTGDTNTGIYFPAADTFAVTTAGVERYRVDSSGNLGVGITPTYKFHVKDGGSEMYFRDNGITSELLINCEAGGNAALFFGDTADIVRGGIVYSVADDSLQLKGYNNTERIRIDSSGNVGVGVTTFGTSAAKVLGLGTGTEPTTGPTGTVQLFTSTRSASNTIPAIFTEGSGVTNAAITNTTVTNKIAIKVNGTIYYLLATTSAA